MAFSSFGAVATPCKMVSLVCMLEVSNDASAEEPLKLRTREKVRNAAIAMTTRRVRWYRRAGMFGEAVEFASLERKLC